MVQQQLVDYIKGQLAQGYTSSQVRSALSTAGYSQNDIEDALHAAGTKHVTTGILVIAFISLIVLIIGILVILHATSEEPANLSASVDLFTPTAQPGSDVVASVTIKNAGGATSGLIDLSISVSGNEIARTTEEFSVVDEKTIPITLKVPADASVGSAEVKADVSYGTKSTSAWATLTLTTESAAPLELPTAPIETVQEDEPTVTAREQQLACPTNCDDLNFCTVDSCNAGTCVNTEITSCCGNNVCDSGENEDGCAVDCADEEPDIAEIGQTAITQSTTDFSAAARTCQTLGQQNYVDICLSDIASAGKNKQGCVDIGNSELRDGCYIQFASQNDAEACTRVENPSLQTSCAQILQLARMQAQNPTNG